MKAHITLARNSHAKGAMAEHFNTDGLAHRPANVLLDDFFVNMFHLFHVQFARQNAHVCELGVKLQRLNVADIQLC